MQTVPVLALVDETSLLSVQNKSCDAGQLSTSAIMGYEKLRGNVTSLFTVTMAWVAKVKGRKRGIWIPSAISVDDIFSSVCTEPLENTTLG